MGMGMGVAWAVGYGNGGVRWRSQKAIRLSHLVSPRPSRSIDPMMY